jgi:hypothetical protein
MQIQAYACCGAKSGGHERLFGRVVAKNISTSNFPEDFMNKPNRFLLTLASSALFCGMTVWAGAQQTPDQQTSPSAPTAQQPNETPSQQQTPPPAQTPNTSPSQPSQTAPGAQAQTQDAGGQVFAGTVTKSGDKYVLQMADGTSYDLDHQDLVKKYEGKQVRVKGNLDADGKTIHITQ